MIFYLLYYFKIEDTFYLIVEEMADSCVTPQPRPQGLLSFFSSDAILKKRREGPGDEVGHAIARNHVLIQQ